MYFYILINMYRALYGHKTDLHDYLSFSAGDHFTVIRSANKDWFQVQNGLGEIGYIPQTYVKEIQASADDVLTFVDWSIEAIHLQASGDDTGKYTQQQRKCLQTLIEHRTEMVKQFASQCQSDRSQPEDAMAIDDKKPVSQAFPIWKSEKRRVPLPPKCCVSQDDLIAITERCLSGLNVTEGTPNCCEYYQTNSDVRMGQFSFTCSPSGELSSNNGTDGGFLHDGTLTGSTMDAARPSSSGSELPAWLGHELLEEVRKNTKLSYAMSKVAVETVLGCVASRMPRVADVMDGIVQSMHVKFDECQGTVIRYDAIRLDEMFSELKMFKDDSQQRTWALYEDEAAVDEYLQEMLSILDDADPDVCRRVVSRNGFDNLHTLVLYFQMEVRGSLRALMLSVFISMCRLEREILIYLSYSVLPLELAQEMLRPAEDVKRITSVLSLMTIIFSTGDQVSTSVSDELGVSFFLKLIWIMEDAHADERVVDCLVMFFLSYNRHITASDGNVIVQAIAEYGTPKIFTERLMILFNRGDDPISVFEEASNAPNPVLKILCDLFLESDTSDVFYTNDAKVLVDIIIRKLSSLSSGNQERTTFLLLAERLLRNSSYRQHCHRSKELLSCLDGICDDTSVDVGRDKHIASRIISAHPVIFNT